MEKEVENAMNVAASTSTYTKECNAGMKPATLTIDCAPDEKNTSTAKSQRQRVTSNDKSGRLHSSLIQVRFYRKSFRKSSIHRKSHHPAYSFTCTELYIGI